MSFKSETEINIKPSEKHTPNITHTHTKKGLVEIHAIGTPLKGLESWYMLLQYSVLSRSLL